MSRVLSQDTYMHQNYLLMANNFLGYNEQHMVMFDVLADANGASTCVKYIYLLDRKTITNSSNTAYSHSFIWENIDRPRTSIHCVKKDVPPGNISNKHPVAFFVFIGKNIF